MGITNRILAQSTLNQPEPEVGMGATVLHWTDRTASTITQVRIIGNKTYVTVQADSAKRIDNNGMSECQKYEYTRNPNGSIYNFRWDSSKCKWISVYYNHETKRWRKSTSSNNLLIGHRQEYYDFSF